MAQQQWLWQQAHNIRANGRVLAGLQGETLLIQGYGRWALLVGRMKRDEAAQRFRGKYVLLHHVQG